MPKLVFKDLPGPWHVGGAKEFPKVTLTQVSWNTSPQKAEAFVFFGYPQIDMDGSPTAYGPAAKHPHEHLTEAYTLSKGWFGVWAMKPTDADVVNGKALLDRSALQLKDKYPVVQQAKNGDPNPGYYVSCTSEAHGDSYRQSSYLNPDKFPYGALDGALSGLGVSLGDVGLAIRHDKNLQSAFYFADTGPGGHGLGECSIRVGTDLGGSFTRRGFDNNFPVSFIVFPSSGSLIPGVLGVPDQTIENNVEQQLFPLSRASNADDLILLMGFNEVRPRHIPQGKQKLDHFNKVLGSPMPLHYSTIMNGLNAYGFQPHRSAFQKPAKTVLDELGL